MSTPLTGKTALVTGSTSGIGRATADLLASRGAHVLVSGRDRDRGDQAVATIRAAGGTADFVRADLGNATSARQLAHDALRVAGRVDILVNNAGIFPFASTTSTTEEQFDQVYALNVKAPLFLVAELAPRMVAQGGGAIVNVSTVVSTKGLPGATAYASSKAALNQLTQIWTAEFAPAGVRVNTVSAGVVETEGLQAELGQDRSAFVSITPVGRVGQPDEIATAIAYLVSDDATFVTGAYLSVDGGAAAI